MPTPCDHPPAHRRVRVRVDPRMVGFLLGFWSGIGTYALTLWLRAHS
jgi:hypothetical protein